MNVHRPYLETNAAGKIVLPQPRRRRLGDGPVGFAFLMLIVFVFGALSLAALAFWAVELFGH